MFDSDMEISVGQDTFATERDGQKLDLLNRAAFGARLSEVMERGDQPLVLALDGAWGSGKSHFLKLWVGTHNQTDSHKARVIYFDAFAQDYLDDPLISLVAAISTARATEQDKGEKALGLVKAWGLKLVRPAARAGLFAASAGISELALPVLDRLADKFIEEASDEAKAAIDNLWKQEESRIAAVEGFRNALTALAADQPLILVIDELDRCRPDYALSLLEVVKHFFAVKGVRFVLGVNLEALEHSVRQRYGVGVDAGLYLQKFMHLQVELPQMQNVQAWESYFAHLCGRLGDLKTIHDEALNTLQLFATRQINLRDVERIVARLAILPDDFGTYYPAWRTILITSLAMETLAKQSYAKLRAGRLTLDEMGTMFLMDQAAENGDYRANFMRHVWARTLSGSTSEEALFVTKGAFGGFEDRKPNIEPFLRKMLDTFAPPPAR